MPGENTRAKSSSGDEASERARVWIDVENPPQVQYLVPLIRTFAERCAEVEVTGRENGITFDLLREQGVPFIPVSGHFGASKRAKVAGTVRRVRDLRRVFSDRPRPDFVVSASRSASLAARSLRIPSFVLCDYECVDFRAFRLAGSFIVHPDVISAEAFRMRGVSPTQLIPYRGIKEDITFANIDFGTIQPYVFPELRTSSKLRVLFRPPAEESHYHRAESSALGSVALRRLAEDPHVELIFSPRYEWQLRTIHELDWKSPPFVLSEPAPFASLLKAIDVVVSGGGTMTREAAYLGIPAITLFRGHAGGVDRYLEAIGRLTIVKSDADLADLDLRQLAHSAPLYTNRNATDDIVDAVFQVARRHGNHVPARG